jgi:hypothetical protein
MNSRAAGPTDRVRVRVLLLALLAGLFCVHVIVATREAFIDDAFISFRYARNLVHGEGLVFNPGDRVEGYTNFSWVMLAALLVALKIDPPTVVPWIGALSGLGMIWAAARCARRIAERDGRQHPLSGIPTAIMLSASTSLAYWAGAGLETAFFGLMMTLAGGALVEERPRAFGLFVGLAFLTRPEAAMLGAVGVGWFVLLPLSVPSLRRRFAPSSAIVLFCIVVPYVCWKVWYFRAWLPNTLAAKPPGLRDGLTYVGWAVLDLVGPLLAAIVAVAPRNRSAREAALLSLWAAYALAVVLEGGDWMPMTRLLVPYLAWLAIAADRKILEWLAPPRRATDLKRFSLGLLMLAYLPQSLLDLKYIKPRTVWAFNCEPLARMLADMNRASVRTVATFDIGYLGWVEPDWRIVDLAGLTDPTIARIPGGHYRKRFTGREFEGREPDAFLITAKRDRPLSCHYAVECNIASLPWFARTYGLVAGLRVAPDYTVLWFQRIRDPRTVVP